MTSSQHWNYRIDHDKHDDTFGTRLGSFIHNYLVPIIDRLIVTKEISNVTKKLHYHIYAVFKTDQKYITLKKNYDKRFPFHSGGMKSLAKVKNPQTNLAYTCKDKNFIHIVGYHERELETYGDLWVPRRERSKMDNIVDKVIKLALDDNVSLTDEEECIRLVHSYYKKNRKLMNYTHMKALVRSLHAEGSPEESLANFAEFCYKRNS